MIEIKDEMYYQVSGWMMTKLHLKGIERDVYAIIYGFSQDGESSFNGSLNYLSAWLGCSRQSIINALQQLIEKDYVIKKSETRNNITFNSYSVNQEILQVVKNFDYPSKENILGGSKKNLHNNNINNNKIIKHIYGEFKHVRLTVDELNKLKSEYGEQTTQDAIKYLDEYIEMKGTQYKSHYMAMRKWVFEALKGNNQRTLNKKQTPIITRKYTNEFLNSLYDSLE